MTLILNPTQETIIAKFDGASYAFRPDERKEIFNTFAAKHILNRWGKYGLVDITFNDKLATKYFDHELYVHDQRIAGLQKCYQSLLELNQNYLTFDEECGDKKTVERLKMAQKRRQVQQKIETVEKLIAALEKVDTRKLLARKAEELAAKAEALRDEAAKLNGYNPVKSKVERAN